MPPSTATGPSSTGTVPDGFPLKVTPLVDRAPDLRCPLLGLFGNEDQFPSPEQVDELEAALEGGRQDLRVPPLRRRRPRVLLRRPPGLPARGRRRRLAADLRVVRPLPGGELTMCSYLTVATEIAGSAKGPQGWFAGHLGQRVLRPPVPRAVRPHAQHRLRRPVRAGPGARVAVELERGVGATTGREHQRGARRRRGRRHVTAPTGPAAGVHLPWAGVPGAVRAWAAEVGGGAPRIDARPRAVASRRGRRRCSTVPAATSSSRRSGPR